VAGAGMTRGVVGKVVGVQGDTAQGPQSRAAHVSQTRPATIDASLGNVAMRAPSNWLWRRGNSAVFAFLVEKYKY
jgi:hypothetical protein